MRLVAISVSAALAGLAASGCCPSTGGGPGGGATTGGIGGTTGGGSSSGSDAGFVVCAQPSSLDFGNVQVQGAPATQTVEIDNCGAYPVNLAFPSIAGGQAADFFTSAPSDTTLGPGESLSFTVTYSPLAMGPSTADLVYTVCPSCGIQQIPLSGVGVDGVLTFAPSPVAFGGSGSQQVTGTNTGTENLTVTSLGTYNSNDVFVVSGAPTLPLVLAPLASFSLTVTYTESSSPGGDSDELLGVFTVADPTVAARTVQDQLSSNECLCPCTLDIQSSVNFGVVPLGSVGTQQVALQNVGDAACQVSAIAVSAGADAGFALGMGQATALTVQPGSSTQIAVTFSSPTVASAPNAHLGQLTFQTSDPTNPTASVPLTAFAQMEVCPYSPAPWPKWHLDNFNSGQTEADTSSDVGNVLWKYNIGAPGAGQTYINSPVINELCPAPATSNGDVIYQMDMTGKLYAIAGGQGGGSVLWMQQLSSPSSNPQPSTPVAFEDDSIIVAAGSAGSPPNLYDLNSAGNVTFSEPFGQSGFASCPALAEDGTVFLADAHGESPMCGGIDGGDPYSAVAFSVDYDAGSVTQLAGLSLPFTAESGQFGVVVGYDDTSYWGNDGQFFAVSPPDTGFTPVPAWPACGVTLTSPSVNAVSNLALDTMAYNNLYAYSAWETSGPDGGYTVQGNLAALDPATGAEIWIFDIPAANLPAGWTPLQSDVGNASPAIAVDGTVYVGGGNGLYALDGATGTQQWLFPSANVSSSPAIGGDGTIFFGCDDGNFYAVTPAGALKFVVPTGGPISSSPAIDEDGTVVFVSDDGNVYAIE